jgi:hypothetical protein
VARLCRPTSALATIEVQRTALSRLILIIGTKAGLVRFVINELLDTFLAAIIIIAVGGFLRADQEIFSIFSRSSRGRGERHPWWL